MQRRRIFLNAATDEDAARSGKRCRDNEPGAFIARTLPATTGRLLSSTTCCVLAAMMKSLSLLESSLLESEVQSLLESETLHLLKRYHPQTLLLLVPSWLLTLFCGFVFHGRPFF
jgi:hypothetical protein